MSGWALPVFHLATHTLTPTQALVDILSHIAEDNGRQAVGQLLGTPLQCLRCQTEFVHQGRCLDQELEDTEAGRNSAGEEAGQGRPGHLAAGVRVSGSGASREKALKPTNPMRSSPVCPFRQALTVW